MAMLVLYHYFNRQEYRGDTRFADYFLVVAPGVTIRDRLGVLRADPAGTDPNRATDYYHVRGLVPRHRERDLAGLNARLTITNYHAFEPKTLKGNKVGVFDGKIGPDGTKQVAMEDAGQVVRRLLGDFKPGRRLLVINDEAHHCYLPKARGKTTEGEDTKEENARAAVWFTGLTEVARQFKVGHVYDLSATPYYLTGSGYPAYSLFGWVVSDFGLIEAIEAGLVKIPFLPDRDTSQELTMPVLRNLYDHVRDQLPKKGQKTRKKEARAAGAGSDEGETLTELPPDLPALVKQALAQFHDHYARTVEKRREEDRARQLTLEDERPPVFIAVCSNTTVSKELFKYVAGYETTDEATGETAAVPGRYDLFSNFDPETSRPRRKPPTLLIDSDALENSGQVDADFRRVFGSEIEDFKRDYALLHGRAAAEAITDAEILREVVNTVGEPGKLGAHIRCVVSVSMLTEGWDANTVTHVMGLRAFGSQLLCEQVAGRALRRRTYDLVRYNKQGFPSPNGSVERFPPEYAHIIGVPFKMFKGGDSVTPPPVDTTRVMALPDRADFEIRFPQLLGYRIETSAGRITADFSDVAPYEVDATKYPTQTTMRTAFSGEEEQMSVADARDIRDQQIVYWVVRELLNTHYRPEDGRPDASLFNQLKGVVEQWYATRVRLVGETDPAFKRTLVFHDPKVLADHVQRGIAAGSRKEGRERVLPIWHPEKFGSTRYVQGHTSKPTVPTEKSHVNVVVADTASWEQIAAKALEELDAAECYVKNEFLGFTVPYVASDGVERRYVTDFVARCTTPAGERVSLMIEITGSNTKDKAEKRETVEHRWLPAVNAVRGKYGYDRWAFIEIAGDIRDIKNQITAKLAMLDQEVEASEAVSAE
jgi:type III restriction enzyme